MVVSAYTTRQQQNEILNLPVTNMECLVFKKFHHNVVVALIYRQSSYKIDLFTANLITLEHKLDRFQGSCIVMGDFNKIGRTDTHTHTHTHTLTHRHSTASCDSYIELTASGLDQL